MSLVKRLAILITATLISGLVHTHACAQELSGDALPNEAVSPDLKLAADLIPLPQRSADRRYEIHAELQLNQSQSSAGLVLSARLLPAISAGGAVCVSGSDQLFWDRFEWP